MVIYQTSESGKRFEILETLKVPKETLMKIKIDLNKRHQSIIGWGGAFTDASGINIARLHPLLQDYVMKSYFGNRGTRYNMGRVPLGCSDGSIEFYTNDETLNNKPDFQLKQFALMKGDLKYKMPYIHLAKELHSYSGEEKFLLIATPWTAPLWMKTNKLPNQGHLINDTQYYRAYAKYFLKFLKEYESNVCKFSFISIQNEPSAHHFKDRPSVLYRLGELVYFINEHLGPLLLKAGYSKDNFDIMIGDDDLLQTPSKTLFGALERPETKRYSSTIAFHSRNTERGSDDNQERNFRKLGALMKEYQVPKLMMTESRIEDPKLNRYAAWSTAEIMARDIIESLQHSNQAWLGWSLVSNIQNGGPSFTGTKIGSPIMIDNDNPNIFYKMPTYYVLAHFSRFLTEGVVRVDSKVSPEYPNGAKLQQVTFFDDNERLLIVNVLNSQEIDLVIEVVAHVSNDEQINFGKLSLVRKSITTVIAKI